MQKSLTFLLFISLLFSSCSKDEFLSDGIMKEWEATSVLIGGEEAIGSLVSSYTLDFVSENELKIKIWDVDEEGFSQLGGSYTVNDQTNTIVIETNSETVTYQATIEKRTLTMIGTNEDGVDYQITAKR